MRQIIAKAALLLMLPALATAQNTDHRPRGLAYVFVGAGTHQMGLTAGFGGEGYVYRGLGMGLEVGTAGVGTAANGNPNWIGLGAADASYHFFPKKLLGRAAPFVAGGYTNLFGQDVFLQYPGPRSPGNFVHGFNIGGGIDLFASKHAGWRALRRSLQRPRRPHPLGIIPQPCSVQFRCLPHRVDVQVGP